MNMVLGLRQPILGKRSGGVNPTFAVSLPGKAEGKWHRLKMLPERDRVLGFAGLGGEAVCSGERTSGRECL